MPSPGAANGMDPFDMYTGYAPTPIFNVEAGYHTGALSITLSTPAGFDIYYTLDGYTPTEGSTLYTGPIDISSTTVVRAIAFDPNDDVPPSVAPSFVATNTYFLGADAHSIPVVSVSGNGPEDGAWGWGGNDELAHVEFFHADGTFWVEASGDSNEHGNDSNAYGQRGFDCIIRDQMGYNHAFEAELFHVKERDEYQRLIFKAAANDNYPFEPGAHIRDAYVHTLSHLADLKLDERTNEIALSTSMASTGACMNTVRRWTTRTLRKSTTTRPVTSWTSSKHGEGPGKSTDRATIGTTSSPSAQRKT